MDLIRTASALVQVAGAKPNLGGGGITVAGNPYERVRWVDYRMYATFERIGLHPNKSRTIGALHLPRSEAGHDYFWLFFRGLFEGDGSITLQGATGTPNQVRLVSGSAAFVAWLARQLHLRGVYRTHIMDVKHRDVGKYIYAPATATHFLCRKIYRDWEDHPLIGGLGHPEKQRRLRSRLTNIESRPGVSKRRLTLPKIESAFITCHDKLGRWP
jgi:hypothetical protein